MSFYCLIPARLASSRLPNKVLLDINGKTMIQQTYEQALKAKPKAVWVATDSDEVRHCVESFGGQVVMTRSDHSTGTDRIAEAAQSLDLEPKSIIVNVQADEPGIPPENIRQVAENCRAGDVQIATLYEPIQVPAEHESTSVVKVVVNKHNYAMYFSRATIPHGALGLRHIGLYAFKAQFLKDLPTLCHAPIEKSESLEQLRWLWNGYTIHAEKACTPSPVGVDTESDLIAMRAQL